MRLRKKVFLSLMIPTGYLVFCLSTGIAVSQTVSEHDAYLEIEKIINRVQTGMKSSDEQIEQGNYDQAQDGTEAAIDSLSILLDLFMPLTERIKLIWEKEKRVIKRTAEVSKEGDRIGKVNPTKVKKLITAQQENIVRTRKAEDAIELQLKQGKDSQNLNDQGRQKDVQSQKDLLNRVGGLLKQAETYQVAAVESLAGHEMKTAHQSEIKAERTLKEALDAFQKHQKQNKQQQAGQPSQSDNESQPQKNKQSDQKNSQKPNQDSGKSEAKSDIKQGSEKKLTPKEALKELYRIRKEADAEKKRREKAVGKQGTPDRAPIEKDW